MCNGDAKKPAAIWRELAALHQVIASGARRLRRTLPDPERLDHENCIFCNRNGRFGNSRFRPVPDNVAIVDAVYRRNDRHAGHDGHNVEWQHVERWYDQGQYGNDVEQRRNAGWHGNDPAQGQVVHGRSQRHERRNFAAQEDDDEKAGLTPGDFLAAMPRHA